MTHKFVGLTPRDLASGRPVAFGDVVKLPDSPPHPADAELIDEGLLVPVEAPKKPARKSTPKPAPTPALDTEEKK